MQNIIDAIFPKSIHGFSLGNTFEGFDYHLGASYIRGVLEENAIATATYINDGGLTLEVTAIDIISQKSKIIGFSVYDSNYHICKLLAMKIKELSPSSFIVFGGPTATFSDHIIMHDCSAVDVCVRSYGEIACLELFRKHLEGKSFSNIKGITFRNGSEVVRVVDRPIEDAIPNYNSNNKHNCLDCFSDPYVLGLIPPNRVADIGIVTSRGCTFPCIYCNCAAISKRRIYYHSREKVIAILNYLNKKVTNPILIAINDDNFS